MASIPLESPITHPLANTSAPPQIAPLQNDELGLSAPELSTHPDHRSDVGPSRPPQVTLSPPVSPSDVAEARVRIELPLSPTAGTCSKKAKGKQKAAQAKEEWDMEDPFGRDISADMEMAVRAREALASPTGITHAPQSPQETLSPVPIIRQPSQQAPMAKIRQHEPPVLRPERSRMCKCLDGPVPKDPEHSLGRYLGELCIGFVLCQCLPCGKHDPIY